MAFHTFLAALSIALIVAYVAHRVAFSLSFPVASGSSWAQWSKAWYIWKVWQGSFEKWNIEAHQGGAQKVVRVAPNMYSIDDPAAAAAIYSISSGMPKTEWYDAFGAPDISNHNLFSARDPKVHGEMRRKVANMYSMSTIKSYEPYVDSCVRILLQHFDKFAATEQMIDLQLWLQCYAFDVISEITFGKRVGFMESGARDIDGIMRDLDNGVAFCSLCGLEKRLLPFLVAKYGNPVKGLLSFAKGLHIRSEDVGGDTEDGRESFVQKLAHFKKTAPEDYERSRLENIVVMGNTAAGSDTTSIALTSAMYYLSTTAGVSERLFNEISQRVRLTDEMQDFSFDQAQKLPYLQMIVKEALRVHPAVGLPIWRSVEGRSVILAGTTFPVGSHLGINSWVAHRNTDVFGPDAHNFIPERWDPQLTTPEKLAQMEKYYLPFGAGSRTCIGRHISQLEMLKLIPQLVYRYELEICERGLNCTNRWFVKPNKVLVKVKRRS